MPPLVTTAVPRSVPWENLEKKQSFRKLAMRLPAANHLESFPGDFLAISRWA